MFRRFETRGGNLNRFILIFDWRFRNFLQGDQSCGLSMGDITFLLMLFADDMVIMGKDRNDLHKEKFRPDRNVV